MSATAAKQATILSEAWLTMREAAKELQRDERTLERWIRDGRIHQNETKLEQREGRVAERMVRKAAVERLKKQVPSAPKDALMLTRPVPRPQTALPLAAMALATPQARPDALWLTLAEAESYSGLGKGFLMKAILAVKLQAVKGGKDGAWVIRRKSLDEFDGKLE